jgi:hypothetical protein
MARRTCRACWRFFRLPILSLIDPRGADSPVIGMRPLICAS